MFDKKQQTAILSAAAAIIILMIGIIGGMGFGAALVWGLLCGGILLQVCRQNILVAEGTDVLGGVLHTARSVSGMAEPAATAPRQSTPDTDAGEAAPADAAPAENRPATLDQPRGGQADDLTRIDGIGPKIAEALNGLGIYHFDQIAQWNDAEVAWVDSNLGSFSGRIRRDDWVSQAGKLAS